MKSLSKTRVGEFREGWNILLTLLISKCVFPVIIRLHVSVIFIPAANMGTGRNLYIELCPLRY
jgi:hypothetical protein